MQTRMPKGKFIAAAEDSATAPPRSLSLEVRESLDRGHPGALRRTTLLLCESLLPRSDADGLGGQPVFHRGQEVSYLRHPRRDLRADDRRMRLGAVYGGCLQSVPIEIVDGKVLARCPEEEPS